MQPHDDSWSCSVRKMPVGDANVMARFISFVGVSVIHHCTVFHVSAQSHTREFEDWYC